MTIKRVYVIILITTFNTFPRKLRVTEGLFICANSCFWNFDVLILILIIRIVNSIFENFFKNWKGQVKSMTFKENINRLCKERGTTLTQLLKSVGVSSSKVTAINNGSLPKEELMITLAHALGCSVMDFFADEEDLKADYVVFDDDETDIITIYREMPREEKHKFLARMYAYRDKLQGLSDK